MNKELIVFYSHSGNTRKAAKLIEKLIGADLLELIPEKKYPNGMWDVVDEFKKDLATGARRKINAYDFDLVDYDTIYIGTPNWGDTVATPLLSFFDKEDLKGKKIAPFVTHGGGGLGRCADDIIKLSESDVWTKPLVFTGARITEVEVGAWLEEIR